MSKLRFKYGENEVELEGSEEFIEKHLNLFYELGSITPTPPAAQLKKDILEPSKKKPEGPKPTPAEFYKLKNKSDGVSQILIFAKYLDTYENVSEFTRAELNKVADLAKQKPIHGQYFTNAVKQGLLRSHGKGIYSLTLSAENVLSAM